MSVALEFCRCMISRVVEESETLVVLQSRPSKGTSLDILFLWIKTSTSLMFSRAQKLTSLVFVVLLGMLGFPFDSLDFRSLGLPDDDDDTNCESNKNDDSLDRHGCLKTNYYG